MLTICLFILFALSLAWVATALQPYAPLLRLGAVPACPHCGARRWGMV